MIQTIIVLASIFYIIFVQFLIRIDFELLVCCILPLLELYDCIKLQIFLAKSEEPEKIVIEQKNRIFAPLLFIFMVIVYTLLPVSSLPAVGLLLYSYWAHSRLNNEIIIYKDHLYYRNKNLLKSNIYIKSSKFKTCRLVKYKLKGKKKLILVKHGYLKYFNIES